MARLLETIPGLKLVGTVFEAGYTCGGSGCDKCPDLKKVEHQKLLDRARAEQIDAVVTFYHTCHAAFVSAEKEGTFKLQNFTDLLVQALGRPPHDDVFKRYRLYDDPPEFRQRIIEADFRSVAIPVLIENSNGRG